MRFKIINPPKNIIFLDVDGVLNHEVFYMERYEKLHKNDNIPLYKIVKKHLRKLVKRKEIGKFEFYKSQVDPSRIELLNELCDNTNSSVVLSASMRGNKTVMELNHIFQELGATFTIIDKTGHTDSRIRGVEIYEWIRDNGEYWFNMEYHIFNRYVIIDDDSDMLLWQRDNFFQTDRYMGLTPTMCYKIELFFKRINQ